MLVDIIILRINGLVEKTIVYPSGNARGLLKLSSICTEHDLSPYNHDGELTIEGAVDEVNEMNSVDGYEIIFSPENETIKY